jgi:hypothetical protein
MSLSRYEEAAMAFRKGVEYEPQNDDLKQKLEDAERQAKYAPKRFREDGVRFPRSCPHFRHSLNLAFAFI